MSKLLIAVFEYPKDASLAIEQLAQIGRNSTIIVASEPPLVEEEQPDEMVTAMTIITRNHGRICSLV